MPRALWAIIAIALGCGGVPEGPVAVPGPDPEESPRASIAPAEVPTRAPEPEAPTRTYLDLAAEVHHADVWVGDTLEVDLGTPAAAKYTLGGFGTSMDTAEIEGRHVTILRGRQGRIFLPFTPRALASPADAGVARLEISARAMRPTRINAYLNGEHLGERPVPAAATMTPLAFTVPAELLRAGDNVLLIRSSRTGPLQGHGAVGLILYALRFGPENESERATAPAVVAEAAGLELKGGARAGFTLEIPPGARLRGVLRSPDRQPLTVEVHTDAGEPRILAEVSAGEGEVAFDLDLTPWASQVARLDLIARTPMRVDRPTIVVPVTEQPRVLQRPKNVLVYLIDTLRADKLRPYNPGSRVQTPGLDAFAEDAVTLLRAHAQENWTKPSVATLLSSLMPWQHTAVQGDSVLPSTVETLPELLKSHAFFTGAFIANGYVSDRFGFGDGWHTYRNYIREGRRTPAQYVASDVLAWLDARPQEAPFFLYVHTIDPHVPYRPPNHFIEMYDRRPYSGPVSFRRDATFLGNVKLGRVRLNRRDRERLEALYDGEISYHDAHFAAIMEGLESRGLNENTMVVVTSDHGEEFWDHGSVGHGHSVYEELLSVPLIIRIPGVTDGRSMRLGGPEGLVDVMPTILDALDIVPSQPMSGRSMLPRILGGHDATPHAVVSGFMDAHRALVVGRHKLIQRPGDRATLYDLEQDPGEQNDVLAERPLVLRHTRAQLGLIMARTSSTAHPRARGPRAHVPQTTEIDRQTREQLRALGYVE